ncbi:hypothetical protein [Streptomyces albus]|uniref:hypothetical protein n=1 Tax=Streptomyces albus TaxID=1888 RepID=UPI00108157FD|nr:hypothetical protein [Streptomyces albus]UVN56330.1 hypothetical protein NR995_18720 [Streptomyces albus]
MESGYLVIRRQGNGNSNDCVGTVRLVEDDNAVVEWPDGQQTRIPLPVASDVTVVPVGSLQYRSLRDAKALRKEFAESPVSVLVTLLSEMGGEASIKELKGRTRELGLASEHNSAWWVRMRERMLAHPHVAESRPGEPLRFLDKPVDPFAEERALLAREALEALATPATKQARGRREALREAVAKEASELSPYEYVAAHALGVALQSWPFDETAYTTQSVSERVLAAAVEFLAEVTTPQRRAKNPVAAPSSKLSKPGAPSPHAVTPLLVGLVTTPVESAAADQAAKLPRGLAAQECVMAVMAGFEEPEHPAGSEHLLRRGAALLQWSVAENSLVTAEQRDAFGEELCSRALRLLLRPTELAPSQGSLYEWVDLVLGAVPDHVLQHATATIVSDDLKAALEMLPDRPNGGRDRATRLMTSLSSRPDGADPASKSQEDSAQTPEAGAGGGPEIPVHEAGQAIEPKVQSSPASAPADSSVWETDTSYGAADTPESAGIVQAFPQEERARYEAALDQERAVARALRGERDDLRQELTTLQSRCDRADEEISTLREQLGIASANLADVTRRAEALTRKAQRQEEELRQGRQAGRAASQSQLRHARIDGLKVLATVLVEVADQAIHTTTDESASAHALYRRVLAQASAAGLTGIGAAGEEVDFHPVHHQSRTGPTARVVVERPGFAWQAGTPQEVVLVPALVRPVEQ